MCDILLREQLEAWTALYPHMFRAVFCVGSRWANVHWGAKSKSEYVPPPPPEGFEKLKEKERVSWMCAVCFVLV